MSTSALRFDPWQFHATAQPVSHSTSISWEDFGRMNVIRHKLNQGRTKDAPEWVYNYPKLRELLVRYCERYAGLLSAQPGTQAERLERVRARLKERRAGMIQLITRLNHEYVELKRSNPRHPKLRTLEIQIENRDTQLAILHRLPEVVLGVVQRYWHQGLNSVECAVALAPGVKPTTVRQMLYRLNQTWERMQRQTPEERAAELARAERKRAVQAQRERPAKARRQPRKRLSNAAREARKAERRQAADVRREERKQAAFARIAECKRAAEARKREREAALVERNTRIVARFNVPVPAAVSFTARTRAVAAEFGVSAGTIREVLASSKVTHTRGRAALVERNARIVARFNAYDGGGSYSARARAVAAEFGITGASVRGVLERSTT